MGNKIQNAINRALNQYDKGFILKEEIYQDVDYEVHPETMEEAINLQKEVKKAIKKHESNYNELGKFNNTKTKVPDNIWLPNRQE